MGMVEYLGSGIPRILRVYPRESYVFSSRFIRIVFPVNPEAMSIMNKTNVINGTITGTMTGTILLNHWERKLLDLIQSDEKISVRKMSKALQLSTSTVQNHLIKLKEKGLLKRIGGTRGYWEISLEVSQGS